MKVTVDRDRCEGHGLCEGVAPQIFALNDDGELEFRFTETVPPGQESAARQAVHVCPLGSLAEVR